MENVQVDVSVSLLDRTDLVAVAEHGREDLLQQRQDVFVRLEETGRLLQLHHVHVGTFGN